MVLHFLPERPEHVRRGRRRCAPRRRRAGRFRRRQGRRQLGGPPPRDPAPARRRRRRAAPAARLRPTSWCAPGRRPPPPRRLLLHRDLSAGLDRLLGERGGPAMTGRLLLRVIRFYSRADQPRAAAALPVLSDLQRLRRRGHRPPRGGSRQLAGAAPARQVRALASRRRGPGARGASGAGPLPEPQHGHSSSSSAAIPSPAGHPRGDRSTDRAIPPASRRTPEESSVA